MDHLVTSKHQNLQGRRDAYSHSSDQGKAESHVNRDYQTNVSTSQMDQTAIGAYKMQHGRCYFYEPELIRSCLLS